MGRFFSVLLFSAVLMLAPACRAGMQAERVFFSMLFPQLIPPCMLEDAEATAGEAVLL